MTVDEGKERFDEYRLILLREGSDAIWAEAREGRMRLPKASVLKRRRPAEQLHRFIEYRWKVCAVVLDTLPPGEGAPQAVMAEIISLESPPDLTPIAINDLPFEELNQAERKVVWATLACTGSTPLSHVGWIFQAIKWLQSVIGEKAQSVRHIRQFNASGSFALVRFDNSSGDRYWLKATGLPNAHEFHVTQQLADLCPESLPQIVSMRDDWNAWLMADAGVSHGSLDGSMLEQAAVSMVVLQKKTIGFTDRFRNLGAYDQRLFVLRDHLPDLMDYLREAMANQTSNRASQLDATDLNHLEAFLHEAIDRMETLKIPDTLVHGDVNSGNILFAKSRCVFTDWCDVSVTNPFIGFEYLSLLGAALSASQRLELREVYKEFWLDRLSPTQIDQAFLLSPPLAALAYLYGSGTWLSSPEAHEPRREMSARTLTRHMHRSIQAAFASDVL